MPKVIQPEGSDLRIAECCGVGIIDFEQRHILVVTMGEQIDAVAASVRRLTIARAEDVSGIRRRAALVFPNGIR